MSPPRHITLPIGGNTDAAQIDTQGLPEALVAPVLELFEGKHLELPILPPSVARLILACGAGAPDMTEVGALVASDPSLTAHILRMANSAGLAPHAPVVSIHEAVCRLGTHAIGDLAISNMVQSFAMGQDHGQTLELYRHAAAASIFSYKLGRILGPAKRASLLPGLLNDIGRPLALAFLADLRGIVPGSIDEGSLELLAEELHEAVGIQLVRSWSLPKNLETIIRYHSRPEEAEASVDLRDAHIAELSNLLASWAIEPESTSDVVLQELDATRELRLSDGQLSTLLSVVGEARAAAATFG